MFSIQAFVRPISLLDFFFTFHAFRDKTLHIIYTSLQ
jgi:hypothetical protein